MTPSKPGGARWCSCQDRDPDLNPIELAFSKIKAFVKRVGARTRSALDAAIAAALKTVTLLDVMGWFAHAGYAPHSF